MAAAAPPTQIPLYPMRLRDIFPDPKRPHAALGVTPTDSLSMKGLGSIQQQARTYLEMRLLSTDYEDAYFFPQKMVHTLPLTAFAMDMNDSFRPFFDVVTTAFQDSAYLEKVINTYTTIMEVDEFAYIHMAQHNHIAQGKWDQLADFEKKYGNKKARFFGCLHTYATAHFVTMMLFPESKQILVIEPRSHSQSTTYADRAVALACHYITFLKLMGYTDTDGYQVHSLEMPPSYIQKNDFHCMHWSFRNLFLIVKSLQPILPFRNIPIGYPVDKTTTPATHCWWDTTRSFNNKTTTSGYTLETATFIEEIKSADLLFYLRQDILLRVFKEKNDGEKKWMLTWDDQTLLDFILEEVHKKYPDTRKESISDPKFPLCDKEFNAIDDVVTARAADAEAQLKKFLPSSILCYVIKKNFNSFKGKISTPPWMPVPEPGQLDYITTPIIDEVVHMFPIAFTEVPQAPIPTGP